MDSLREEIDFKLKTIDMNDYTNILKLSRKLSKLHLEQSNQLKIAILGSYSIQYFVMVLKLCLLGKGIDASIYEGDYNGINMDILNRDSSLYDFYPTIVIVLSDYRDIKTFPPLLADTISVNKHVKDYVDYYRSLWENLSTIKGCHIFQSNIILPLERSIGNLEQNYYFSSRNYLNLINIEFIQNRPNNVTIVDLDYIASNIGKMHWFDPSAYVLNKAGFSIQYIGIVCDTFAKQISALCGNVKKCLILDLDNTLWGGVVGDEGYESIQVDPNNPEGEAYLTFQKYILNLKNRGVILAVCSKNDIEVAKEPFIKNTNMILKLDDFSIFIANWDDKVKNIKKISNELNIGLDSLVFFDDNPAEREIVKMYLPEVTVIDVPKDPAYYARILELASPFEWIQITAEDKQRSDSYIQNSNRNKLATQFTDYNEYLKVLEMEGSVNELTISQIERFSQLINKSNQFNLRTQRYSEAVINELLQDKNYKLLSVSLIDKFSSYGIISCVVLKKVDACCVIDSWVMSCRVLKRGIENLTFLTILEVAKNWKCTQLVGEYIPSKKNCMVKELYTELGFLTSDDITFRTDKGSKIFIYNVNIFPSNQVYIKSKGNYENEHENGN